jgi:ABC-2 type transport system permease protein
MIILSLIAGYIHKFNLGPASMALLFLNSLAFMLNAASSGVLLLLILMLLANRFGLKKILYIMISGYILSILLFFEINSPRILVTTVMKHYPSVSKDFYLEGLVPGFTKFLPGEWLAQSGYWLVRGNFYNSLLYSALQFLLMLVLCGTVFYAGQRWYLKTWLLNLKIELMTFVRSKKKIPFLSFDTKTFLSPRRDALLKREILLFVREPSQILHLIVLLFLIAVFIVSVAGIKFAGIGNFYLQTMIYFSIFIFNLLFISTLSLRFVFPLISLEGEAYWKVRSAPVKPKELLIGKIFIYSVIILLLSAGLSYFSNYNFGKELTLFAVVITSFAGMAIIAINLGMGGLHANFREKNPIRLSSSQGASLSFLVNIVFMLFLIIILFKPLSQMFLSIMIKRPISLGLLYETLIPVIVTSSLLIMIFSKIALNSLKNDI